MSDNAWTIHARDVPALLNQAWYLAAKIEGCADELPDDVVFEARAFAAMTGERVEGCNPFRKLCEHLGVEPA